LLIILPAYPSGAIQTDDTHLSGQIAPPDQ
jgi:hypothetical protein